MTRKTLRWRGCTKQTWTCSTSRRSSGPRTTLRRSWWMTKRCRIWWPWDLRSSSAEMPWRDTASMNNRPLTTYSGPEPSANYRGKGRDRKAGDSLCAPLRKPTHLTGNNINQLNTNVEKADKTNQLNTHGYSRLNFYNQLSSRFLHTHLLSLLY